jgi:glycosyltransferase involved in cell wall biosynthesis
MTMAPVDRHSLGEAGTSQTRRRAPVSGPVGDPCSVLLVSWYFPPDNAIAAIRIGKMARFLEESGHRVRVVTPEPQSGDRSLAVEMDAQAVTRTRYLDLDRRFNPANRSRIGTELPDDSPPTLRQRLLRSARRLLGRTYRSIAFYPDKRVDWCLTLMPALARQIQAERPDLILVSGPPFSSFLAAALAAWWFDIPWIAEFRDRWADDPYAEQPAWRRWIDHRLERAVVSRAAGIVTVSGVWSGFYAGKYGLPVETVMNGFDPKDFSLDIDPPLGLPVRLLHAGTIYPGRRDPRPLFEAIRRHGMHADELRVRFCGRQLAAVASLADAMGLEDVVEIRDAIPYKDAVAMQKRSDVLLLMQWNDPADEGNVPAKIFEYFATNRQILGLGPLNGVPAKLVQERAAGLYANDPDAIAAKLRLWIEEKRRTGRVMPPARKAASGLEREAQYRRLLRFCRALIEERSHRQQQKHPTGPLATTLSSPCFAEVHSEPDQRPTITVVIDTEADFDWHGPFLRDGHETTSIRHQQRTQRLFDRFGIKPTYLIDYPIATDPEACSILKSFLDEGRADVVIQLHPWTNPPFDELLSARNSYPSNLPRALQQAKIERLIEAVQRHLGLEPKVFKAGRYGFNDDTALLLEQQGLEIDTSVVPFTDFRPVHGPNFGTAPHRPFWFGQRRALLELPMTRNLCGLLGRGLGRAILPLIQSRPGTACHLPGLFARSGLLDRLTLTPEGMALDELKQLTSTLLQRGERIFTFVFHSPSVASGNTPYVQNEAELQAFLTRIERYLRFFTGELGGAGRSALELRAQLLTHRAATPDGGIATRRGAAMPAGPAAETTREGTINA